MSPLSAHCRKGIESGTPTDAHCEPSSVPTKGMHVDSSEFLVVATSVAGRSLYRWLLQPICFIDAAQWRRYRVEMTSTPENKNPNTEPESIIFEEVDTFNEALLQGGHSVAPPAQEAASGD